MTVGSDNKWKHMTSITYVDHACGLHESQYKNWDIRWGGGCGIGEEWQQKSCKICCIECFIDYCHKFVITNVTCFRK